MKRVTCMTSTPGRWDTQLPLQHTETCGLDNTVVYNTVQAQTLQRR